MSGGLSPLPIDKIFQEHDRTAHGQYIELQKQLLATVPEITTRLALTAAEAGRWTKYGEMFDMSLWQQKKLADGTITTSVRWDLLHHKKFFGGYHKHSEAWGNYLPQSDMSQKWLDPTGPSNRKAKLAEGMLNLEYIYSNTAWARDLAWTEGSMKDLFVGTIDAVANKLIHNVPDLYLMCLMCKLGTGQTFTASQLKSDPDAPVDGIVLDVEKHWMSNGAEVGDFWNGLTVDTTAKGLKFLCENGYLRKDLYDTFALYGSEWWMGAYGNYYARLVFDQYDTIPAGYAWDENKVGYFNVQTIDELLTLLDTIPAWWQPYNIGASVPGKIVLAYQIAANITMPQVTGPTGGPSAIDVNALNISEAALLARYPLWAARKKAYDAGTLPPPDPDPDPVPVPVPTVKKYWAVVKPTTTILKLRTDDSTTAPVLQVGFKTLAPMKVTLSEDPDGLTVWATTEVSFGVRKGADVWVDLVEIPAETK